ncbi:hypothetical protein LCGC14_0453900 [marine sediment metagenome]|uniref:Uncharacterized protein n=1 Tax=marine sediment metagenome TaxID=412755 RepID=A0A0F9SGY1_9ZZZZ|nr:hypothetical protein [bacterium]
MELKQNNFREYLGAISIPEYTNGTDICLICFQRVVDLCELVYDKYCDEIFHFNCFMFAWEESANNFAWYNDGVTLS